MKIVEVKCVLLYKYQRFEDGQTTYQLSLDQIAELMKRINYNY